MTERDGDFDDHSTLLHGGVARPASGFTLVVVDGPDRGAVFPLDEAAPGRVLVGQSPACAIRLADRHVSRRHAALETRGGRLTVTDLESTNGTFIDGVSIVAGHLRAGDALRVGETVFRVEASDAPRRATLSTATSFGRVVGPSEQMRRLYPLCERLAATSVAVIIEGETGTGKEGLAEALHEMGPRAAAPFVVFDCTAVPPNLLESELFGHERGAFTGAVAARKGVFEQAHGGTLLIDEIGDLDASMQPKLLRALERSEIKRVGGNSVIRVDVRVLAATRRDLDREVAAGRFRDDLFHRLAVARIELPPLRQRWGDVPFLARHFWKSFGGAPDALSREVVARWNEEAWPGNVRELRNAVARLFALGDLADEGARSERAPATRSVPPPVPTSTGTAGTAGTASTSTTATTVDPIARILARDLPLPVARRALLEEFESRYVDRVLAQHGGNTAKAAAASGVARRWFQLLLAKRAK